MKINIDNGRDLVFSGSLIAATPDPKNHEVRSCKLELYETNTRKIVIVARWTGGPGNGESTVTIGYCVPGWKELLALIGAPRTKLRWSILMKKLLRMAAEKHPELAQLLEEKV